RGYLHRVVRDARVLALETVTYYDEVGNVIGVRNPRGVVTTFEVNALNEIITVTRGADVSHAVATGQLVTGELPLAYRSRNYYDHNGRVMASEVENRDGNTE